MLPKINYSNETIKIIQHNFVNTMVITSNSTKITNDDNNNNNTNPDPVETNSARNILLETDLSLNSLISDMDETLILVWDYIHPDFVSFHQEEEVIVEENPMNK